MPARIAGRAGEELDAIGLRQLAVERSEDRRHASAGGCPGQDGIVLQIVRAGVDIARVVGRHAVAVEIDSKAPVGKK